MLASLGKAWDALLLPPESLVVVASSPFYAIFLRACIKCNCLS